MRGGTGSKAWFTYGRRTLSTRGRKYLTSSYTRRHRVRSMCTHRPSNLPKMAFDDATHAHILSAHLHRAYCWTKMIIRILQMPNRMLACPVINGTSARSPRRHRRRSPQFDVMYHQIRPEDTQKIYQRRPFVPKPVCSALNTGGH